MGWTDTHLYEFVINVPGSKSVATIGIPDNDDIDLDKLIMPGWEIKIKKFFTLDNKTSNYIYDYGDCWQHKILLEKIMPAEKDVTYPICVAGKRACPPEDCGGSFGYEETVNGESEFQKEYNNYDLEYFSPEEVIFEDPVERLKFILR